MQTAPLSLLVGDLSNYDQQVLALEDQRPHPTESQLDQVGTGIMNELLDMLGNTALEDFQPLICEAMIGGLHSAVQRLERDADRSRDSLARLERDFDGTEIADMELQDAQQKTRALDVAVYAMETLRDAAAAAYTSATGEVWTAWKGNVRASKVTAAQMAAKDILRASAAAKHAAVNPGAHIVAFRGSPRADTQVDASRIFDALNWAHNQYPDMALATTGAKGAEKIAIRWAKQKNVPLVMASAEFDRHGSAAPFKANDEILRLNPTVCITIPRSLDPQRDDEANQRGFGPALNMGQKAKQAAVKQCFEIKARQSA